MRARIVIEKESKQVFDGTVGLSLEVLLDIRDLLLAQRAKPTQNKPVLCPHGGKDRDDCQICFL